MSLRNYFEEAQIGKVIEALNMRRRYLQGQVSRYKKGASASAAHNDTKIDEYQSEIAEIDTILSTISENWD